MAENLWALREQKKLSVATLASRAGLPIGLIMQYESGQRSIDPRHISRLARALYVEDTEIKLHADPRPGSGPLERQPRREERRPSTPAAGEADAPPRPRERISRSPRPAPLPRPPISARPSQIAHLTDLLTRLGRSQAEVEAELGKPLAELDRVAVSEVLAKYQTELREGRGAERRRAYLPEAVDGFEFNYLTSVQAAQDTLRFTLFDGGTVTGQVIGFGQYNVTMRQTDGSELTLNKLALVSYQKLAAGDKEPAP